jgi:nitroimidazol reductase NimA-like FMN-containing flavoprotein (pyridoxamine 5'-phosphate oxidase superfamily)
MLGTLAPQDIEDVLSSQAIGRIGYVLNGRPTVVPITYVYDGEAIYAHTREGEKVRAMRVCPNVCFEVEEVKDMTNWRSVVAHGTFEQLAEDPEERAMNLLVARLTPLMTSETARVHSHSFRGAEPSKRPVLFRIKLSEKSGRFERTG